MQSDSNDRPKRPKRADDCVVKQIQSIAILAEKSKGTH